MKYTLLSILSILLFATYPTIAKPLLATAHPLAVVAMTGFLSSLVVAFIFGLIPEIRKGIKAKKKDGYIILLAFLSGALGPTLHLIGLTHSSVVNAVLLMALATPITACFSWIFLKEKISVSYVAGILILFIGLTIYSTEFFQTAFHFQWNDLYFLAAATVFASADVMYKKKLSHVPHEFVLLMRNFIGSFILITGLVIFSYEVPTAILFQQESLTGIVLLAIFPILLAQGLWYTSLEKIKLKEAAFIDALYPIFSSLFAFIILQEKITPAQMIGGCVMIGGLIFAQVSGRRFSFHHDRTVRKNLRAPGGQEQY